MRFDRKNFILCIPWNATLVLDVRVFVCLCIREAHVDSILIYLVYFIVRY